MMLYDVLWCCMMLYDVIAVDFIAELCVFQLNAKLKPSYIPRCGIFRIVQSHKTDQENCSNPAITQINVGHNLLIERH